MFKPRLWNPYKLKRRLRQRSLSSGLPFTNPYRVKVPLGARFRIKIFLVLAALIALVAILIYHPFFHIQEVKVAGVERLKKADIVRAVEGIINTRRWLIFPGQSYLWVDVDEMKEILQEKFPLQSLRVQKTFPQELSIQLEEKLSTIIYDNGKQYSYLGLDGKVVEVAQNVVASEWVATAATTTAANGPTSTPTLHVPAIERIRFELGRYPVVYDTREKIAAVNDLVLPESLVAGIIAWWQFFNKQTNIPISYLLIDDDSGVAQIITGEGWRLWAELSPEGQKQAETLQFLLREKISDRRALKLIDLRFPGRVYWE